MCMMYKLSKNNKLLIILLCYLKNMSVKSHLTTCTTIENRAGGVKKPSKLCEIFVKIKNKLKGQVSYETGNDNNAEAPV